MTMTQRYAGMLRRQAGDWDKQAMPVQAELERLRAENAALKRDLQYARDGLTKGRTRMREDNERLRAALVKIEAGCCIDPRTVAREALGPNAEVRRAP